MDVLLCLDLLLLFSLILSVVVYFSLERSDSDDSSLRLVLNSLYCLLCNCWWSDSSLIELLTYYVIAVFDSSLPLCSLPLCLHCRTLRVVWLDIRIIKCMVIRLSTKTRRVIQTDTSYKLAEIIRDTFSIILLKNGETK